MPSSRIRAAAPVAATILIGLVAHLAGIGRRLPGVASRVAPVRTASKTARIPLLPGWAKLLLAIVVAIAALGLGVDRYNRQRERVATAIRLTGGDPGRAEAHILRYGCSGCHVIPGIRGPGGRVGPSLEDVARRIYLGGVVTNTPENMISWIVDPRAIDPKTAMPVTGISREEARDVAAYLYSR
jgi:cytochrome c2